MLFRKLVPLSHIRNNRLRYRETAMASTTQAGSAAAPPWHAAYPAPRTEAGAVSRDEVLSMLKDPKSIPGKDFILVDLRRADHEVPAVDFLFVHLNYLIILLNFLQGETIRGSINLPAQSLWPTIPTIYAMFKAAGLRKVIWYCGRSTCFRIQVSFFEKGADIDRVLTWSRHQGCWLVC